MNVNHLWATFWTSYFRTTRKTALTDVALHVHNWNTKHRNSYLILLDFFGTSWKVNKDFVIDLTPLRYCYYLKVLRNSNEYLLSEAKKFRSESRVPKINEQFGTHLVMIIEDLGVKSRSYSTARNSLLVSTYQVHRRTVEKFMTTPMNLAGKNTHKIIYYLLMSSLYVCIRT